jgi:hypothetical protein
MFSGAKGCCETNLQRNIEKGTVACREFFLNIIVMSYLRINSRLSHLLGWTIAMEHTIAMTPHCITKCPYGTNHMTSPPISQLMNMGFWMFKRVCTDPFCRKITPEGVIPANEVLRRDRPLETQSVGL